MRRFLCVALLCACAGGAVEAQFDDAIGIWFPSYASRDTYLNGTDPAHSYAADVKRAFQADPQLAASVCSAVAQWKPPAKDTTDPRVLQKRAMLRMMCVGDAWKRTTDAAIVAARAKLDLALADAQASPYFPRQYASFDEFLADLPQQTERARLANVMRVVVMQAPSTSATVHLLLKQFSAIGGAPSSLAAYRIVNEFLAARAKEVPSFEWLAAQRYALFFTGDYKGARATMNEPNGSKGSYDPLFLALLDRIDGNREAFDREIHNCPKPSAEEIRAMYGYEEPEIHCRVWLENLALWAMDLEPVQPSPVLRDIIRENAASPFPIIAVNAAKDQFAFDPAGAKKNAEVLTANREHIASGIYADALLILRNAAFLEKDDDRAIQLIDCWMETMGFDAALPADGWSRLTRNDTTSSPVRETPQVERMYAESTAAALRKKNFARMRHNIERLLAFELEGGGHLDVVRDRLRDLANADAGNADAIRAYLAGSRPVPWTPEQSRAAPSHCN